jgi:ParB/RepB/Spo0J family partition protein
MKAVEKEETIVWIPVKNIHPNKYNPNAMTEEQDAQLLEDMRQHGPNAIAPLDVRTDLAHDGFPHPIEEVQFEIIDGEHRWNHAVALGWERIRCVVKDMTLAEAKAANYRKNRERGTIDPFKEAELFKSESDEGLTQEEIAKKYGVDRSQVSKRISLLNITPETKKEITKVPHVTVSHLEPIATMTPQLQKEAVKELKRDRYEPRVSDVEEVVERVKREDKERRELEAAVAKAKFKKCPDCGEKPEEAGYSLGLPWVHCRHYHEWSLETGKAKRETYGSSSPSRKPKGKKRPFEGFLRTTHTVPEISRVFGEAVRSLVDDFVEIDDIQVSGRTRSGFKGYVRADVDVTSSFGRQHTVDLTVRLKGRDEHISAEPKTYASKRLKDIKALVRSYPEPKNPKQLRAFEKHLEDLFRRFGKKRRVRKTKKRKKP